MSSKFHKAIFHALLAAALYAVSIPFSKLLLTHLAPTLLDTAEGFSFSLGSLLELGATICWGIENNCTHLASTKAEE